MQTPERIAGYRIEARLDQSGSSEVYKAIGEDGRPVALKLYPGGEDEPTRRRRLVALARARGFDHAYLQRVLDAGETDGRVYAVSEFVQGASLAEIGRHRRLPLATTLTVLRKAAEGLEAMLRQGGEPDGLTPGDVIVHGDGRVVKLIEPGMPLTVVDDPGATATIRGVHSMRYLAPERLTGEGGPAGPSVVYSLGVIGYEALTGSSPKGQLQLPSAVDSKIPPAVDPVLLRCLAKRPAERYPTPATLARDLAHLERDHGTTAGVRLDSRGWRWILLAGLALLAIGAAWLLLG